MNCHEAAAMIDAHADRELDRLRGHALEKHLRDCPGCAAAQRRLLALRARLHAEVPYYRASPALRSRLRAVIDASHAAMPPAPRPAAHRWSWLTGGALAGCAATLLAFVVGSAVVSWSASADLAAEAVATHVRATLGERLIEVASSDQHTVKPWLSARLDYSPPVEDLAGIGFTLVGGRLDTLEQRPVATLVYRYRLHTIDVFVRPASTEARPVKLRTVRGFNVARATGSGMDWLAVSDVNAEVLDAFVERLARGHGPR